MQRPKPSSEESKGLGENQTTYNMISVKALNAMKASQKSSASGPDIKLGVIKVEGIQGKVLAINEILEENKPDVLVITDLQSVTKPSFIGYQ